MTEKTKHCRKCDTVKVITEFHRDMSSRDGRNLYCKDCVKLYVRCRTGASDKLPDGRSRWGCIPLPAVLAPFYGKDKNADLDRW